MTNTVFLPASTAQRDRLSHAAALGISPYVVVSESAERGDAVELLVRAGSLLGFDQLDSIDNAESPATEMTPTALVLAPNGASSMPPCAEWTLEVVAVDNSAQTGPLTLSHCSARRNHHNAVANLTLVGDVELGTARRIAASKGADEAVWTNLDGGVACAGTSSIFVRCDGEVLTPPLRDGVPDTLARRRALTRHQVRETTFDLATLLDADEACCVNADGSAQAIASIDGTALSPSNLDEWLLS